MGNNNRVLKRALAVFWVVLILITSAPLPENLLNSVKANAAIKDGNNVQEPIVEIWTVEDFINIKNDLSANYVLMNDIDLSYIDNWTSIGDSTNYAYNTKNGSYFYDNPDGNFFTGHLDGNGFTIRGLNFNRKTVSNRNDKSAVESIGLFAHISDATITDLNIEDVNVNIEVTDNSGSDYQNKNFVVYGTICATAFNSTIENCRIKNGTVSGNGSFSAGGVVGAALSKNTLRDIFIDLSGKLDGGIAYSAGEDFKVDGTLLNQYTMIQNCINNGDVNGAGITKSIYGRIINCYNFGDVKLGGIAYFGYKYAEITDCINYGNVEVNKNGQLILGGIISKCCTNQRSKITNCYNYGDISVTTNVNDPLYLGLQVAGISADINATNDITNCANYGNIIINALHANTVIDVAGVAVSGKFSGLLENYGNIEIINPIYGLNIGGVIDDLFIDNNVQLKNYGNISITDAKFVDNTNGYCSIGGAFCELNGFNSAVDVTFSNEGIINLEGDITFLRVGGVASYYYSVNGNGSENEVLNMCNSYNAGNICVSDTTDSSKEVLNVGSLFGLCMSPNLVINNSYGYGKTTLIKKNMTLSENVNIGNIYGRAPKLTSAKISNCYIRSDFDNMRYGDGDAEIIDRLTVINDFSNKDLFDGFDFVNDWKLDNGKYPTLRTDSIKTAVPLIHSLVSNNIDNKQIIDYIVAGNTNIDSYYFGVEKNPDDSDFVTAEDSRCLRINKIIYQEGVYFLIVKDKNGHAITNSTTLYKTTLDANGGTVSPSYVITKSGYSFTFPVPSKSGYTYAGWSTSSTATSGTKTLTPSSNSTYYAVWTYVDTEKPTGSISSSNNVATSQTVTLSLQDNVGVAGYYWGTSSSYSNNTYTATSSSSITKTISSSGTYYLTVKDTSGNVSTNYSITFYKTTLNANGGTVSPSYVITKSGNSFTFPVPSKSGYTYAGWSTSSTATSGIKTLTPSSNSTYYAVWTYVDTEKPTGSIGSSNNVATSQTVTLSLQDNVGVAGYYWGTSSSYGNNTYTATSSSSVTKTISSSGTYYLTVKDTSGNVSTNYSITFYKTTLNANGGTVSPSYVITKSGNSFTFPVPSKSGYTYAGWSTSSTATSGIKTLTPSSNSTYYAVWNLIQNSFAWSKDNWNFNNSSYSGYFSSGTYRSQINSKYQKKLKDNLTNSEYQVVFTGNSYSDAWLDDYFGGSCYGMSATTLLAKLGYLPYSSYKSGATDLYSLSYPKIDSNISSLITYYQMLQVKSVIQQQYRSVPYKSNETNIKRIISLLDENPTVLVGFQKNGWGGHAILAYDYEYGSWTFNGITYQGCIKICDPNSSKAYNSRCNIYFNTRTYSWAIPYYNSVNITSANGAVFNYVGAEVSEINQGGYLSVSSIDNNNKDFIARIDAVKIGDTRSVAKVSGDNRGNYVTMNTAPGDIIEDYSYVLSGESKETIGYNIFDADAAYKVTQSNPVELSLSMDYEKCDLSGRSAAGKTVIFDSKGYVYVEGESADYNLAMTFDEDYPTDWFSIAASGKGADEASIEKTSNGYILASDNLKNVYITANNKEVTATKTFSTSYSSVLIYEIDETTIGVKVDTDSDGVYETELAKDNEIECQHKYTSVVNKPTCITDGFTTHTCSVCGDSYTDRVVKAKGHSEKSTVTKATMTKDGKIVTACTECGAVSKTSKIYKASTIKLSGVSYTYDGKAKVPSVTVQDSKGKTLVRNTDYTASYATGRTNPGRYAVTVTLKGNYAGTKTLYFDILPGVTSRVTATQSTNAIKLTWNTVSKATGYRVYLYNTKTKKYQSLATTTKNTYTITKLTAGTDYIFAVRAYSTVGGKVFWASGFKTIATATKPNTPTLKAIAGTRKVTLSWNKQVGADGYVVYMSTSKNGKYTKIATVKGNAKLSFTKTGLTKGKTYYFKVAAYSTVGGKNIYSSFSSVKYAKVK